MATRYIKDIGDKWYDVHVEFDSEGVGHVTEVFITDTMPEIDERYIEYIKQ